MGLGCIMSGSEGWGGGVLSVISSRRVYMPSLATKDSSGVVTRLGASMAVVNPRAMSCCSRIWDWIWDRASGTG